MTNDNKHNDNIEDNNKLIICNRASICRYADVCDEAKPHYLFNCEQECVWFIKKCVPYENKNDIN